MSKEKPANTQPSPMKYEFVQTPSRHVLREQMQQREGSDTITEPPAEKRTPTPKEA